MENEIKHVYVGCALRDLPKDKKEIFLKEVEDIRSALAEAGYEVARFIGLGDHSPDYVYGEDIKRMRQSDIVVAVCDYPSTGLGIEVGLAIGMGKHILAVSKKEDITKMITGAPAHEKNVKFYCYKDISEIVSELNRITSKKD